MPSVSYVCTVGNSNRDLVTGATITEHFARSGDAPPAGSKVISATLTVSSFRTYSGKGMYLSLGPLGTSGAFSQNDAVHSDTVGASVSDNILSFAGGSVDITIYTTSSSSGNQLNFRTGCTLTLTVNYLEQTSASSGWLSVSNVNIGGSITLNIAPASSGVSHQVAWSLGSYSTTNNVATGGTANTFIIPNDWANAISGLSAIAKATLYTYSSSGSFVGSIAYTFTVSLSSTSPTIASFTATHIRGDVPSSWPVYVQGKSKVQLMISGAMGTTGSGIAIYRISGGGYSFSSASVSEYTTGLLTTEGTITFTGSVTDTRGYTGSKTMNITVVPYAAPSILSVIAFRCTSSGAVSETGAYVSIKADAAYSNVSGYNVLSITVQYRKVGATSWSVASALTNGQQKIINAEMSGTSLYEIRVCATDSLSSVEKTMDVTAAQYTMYFANGGQNVSIGKAGARQNALEINPDWKIYHGDVDLTTKINEATGTVPVSRGGTGAVTAAAALANLGAVAANHNHAATDVNSGVLPVARGGTGASSLAAGRALVTNASGNLEASAVTSAKLAYLNNVTSDIQTQLNGKLTLKIAYGTANIDGNMATTINYSSAGFSMVPYIAVTYSTTAANWSGDNGAIKVYSKNTISASIIVGGSFATSRQVDWIAVGL